MLNCPGRNLTPSPSRGSSSNVKVSAVSRHRRLTRNGRGSVGSAANGSDKLAVAIDVDEADPRRLETATQDGGEALHELVAQLRVLVALVSKAGAVKGYRPHGRDRAPV